MLPPIVEYLFSLRKPNGDALVFPGALQTIVSPLPPNVPLYFTFAPPVEEYCHIWFRTYFGHEMIPYAIDGWALCHEGYLYSGTIDSEIIREGVNYFVPLFPSRPLSAYVLNTSGLNQFYCSTGYYILVKSKLDYEQMMANLAAYAGLTDPRAGILSQQAASYLTILERGKI